MIYLTGVYAPQFQARCCFLRHSAEHGPERVVKVS